MRPDRRRERHLMDIAKTLKTLTKLTLEPRDARLGTAETSASRLGRAYPELLAFRARYLEERLLKLEVVESCDEAHALFQELKRYLVLADQNPALAVPMYSLRIDRVWHEFVLFTEQYTEFCARFAGHYLHHQPASSATSEPSQSARSMSPSEFRLLYESCFGELPLLWRDDLAVTEKTRLCWSGALQRPTVRLESERAELIEEGEPNQLLCRTATRALSALHFITEQRFFHVRELPGLVSPREAVALVRPLVRWGVLHIAV